MKNITPNGEIQQDEKSGDYFVFDETGTFICRTPHLRIAESSHRIYTDIIMCAIKTRREKVVLLSNKYDQVGCASSYINLIKNDEYTQLSTIVEVDFPMLDDSVVLADKIRVIDGEIVRAQEAVYQLQCAKKELQALPHEEEM
jgi:hypothetical protein